MNTYKVYGTANDNVVVYTIEARDTAEAYQIVSGFMKVFQILVVDEKHPMPAPDNVIKIDFITRKRTA